MEFVVSYKDCEDGVACTNIAIASEKWLVEREYSRCAWYVIEEAPAWKVAELRAKGCPTVDCRERFDRCEVSAEIIDTTTDAASGRELALVCVDGRLCMVTGAESSEDGLCLYYDELIREGSGRHMLLVWADLIREEAAEQ